MSQSDVASTAAAETGESVLARVQLLAKRVLTHELALISGVLALLVIVFFYDIVFLGRTLQTSSFLWGVMGTAPPFGYPDGPPDYNVFILDPLGSAVAESTAQKIADIYRNFDIPLWDTSIASGRPVLASNNPSAVSPLRLPLMLSPSPAMWDAFLVARFFVAGLFTYLFVKRLGTDRLAALGAAVAFMFSGYFMLYINMPHAEFAMLIPVLLYAFELLFERRSAGTVIFAAGAVALGTLADNPETTVVLLVYGGSYYLARVLTEAYQQRSFRPLHRCLPLGVTMGTGVGLAAFALVPFIELAGFLDVGGLSVHRHTTDSGIGVLSTDPRHLISLFVPYFNGTPVDNFQGTGWSGIRNYVGVVVPLLAFIGLWNRRLMGKAGWFFVVAAVLLLAKTYGVPVVNWVGHLPVFNVIDFGLYVAPGVAFSLAVLAAFGLDQLAHGRWRGWQVLAGAALLAALLGWLVWLNRGILDSIPNRHLAIQLGLAFTLVAIAGVLIFAIRRGFVPVRIISILLVALVAGELFAFSLPTKGEFAVIGRDLYGQDVPVVTRPQRYDPFTEPPYVSFLKQDESKYRVFGLDRLLYPNTSGAYGIEDIRGYTALTLKRYFRFIQSFLNPSVRSRFTGAYLPPLKSERLPTSYVANPMFDLLNVKYVITRRGLVQLHDHALADAVLSASAAGPDEARLEVFRIDGQEEAVLFQHPPSSLSYEFTPSEGSRFLVFRLALDPGVWRPDRGDGVLFTVSIVDGGSSESLFSRWVDPKNDPNDRRWLDGAVDLSAYLGRPVTLTLTTGPGESLAYDWAGWGGLRLASSAEAAPSQPSSSQFELVYDGEVEIYRNNNAFPRAFVVHRAEVASGVEEAIDRMKQGGFEPSRLAVIEGDVPQAQLLALEESPVADGSSVAITRYKDNKVELRANMENPGLLILSDNFYPGWKAYVDGEEAPIYPTDATLRSVFVGAGEHEVEFVYSPRSFKAGLMISAVSLLVLAAYAAWGPVRSILARYGRGRR